MEFRMAVQDYIIDSIEFTDDMAHMNDTGELEQVEAIYEQFKTEGYGTEQERRQNRQEAFTTWVAGLPANFHIAFATHEQIELMTKWFEAMGVEYDEDRFTMTFFYNIIAREFFSLVAQAEDVREKQKAMQEKQDAK